jgi:hypothetical protein
MSSGRDSGIAGEYDDDDLESITSMNYGYGWRGNRRLVSFSFLLLGTMESLITRTFFRTTTKKWCGWTSYISFCGKHTGGMYLRQLVGSVRRQEY